MVGVVFPLPHHPNFPVGGSSDGEGSENFKSSSGSSRFRSEAIVRQWLDCVMAAYAFGGCQPFSGVQVWANTCPVTAASMTGHAKVWIVLRAVAISTGASALR